MRKDNNQIGNNNFNLMQDSLTKEEREDKKAFELSIPLAPSPFIVHDYGLLKADALVGRTIERSLLIDWVSNMETGLSTNSVFCLVSMGGMGKTALTWNFFNKTVSNVRKDLKGSFWWSFYEPKTDSNILTSDKVKPRGTFDNFLIYALAYVSKNEVSEIVKLDEKSRKAKLLNELGRKPYLLVLDGLERLLRAYNRPDLLSVEKEEFDSDEFVDVNNLSKVELRSAIDSKVDDFLMELMTITNSKILVTSRLLPSILQTEFGKVNANCNDYFLKGLEIDEALLLWHSLGATGSEKKLRELFDTIKTYPILISVLANEVSKNQEAEGNYDKWLVHNPEFSIIFSLGGVQEKLSKVLKYSLERLNVKVKSILNRIVEFDMPINYLTLSELTIEIGKIIKTRQALDKILIQLKDRALIGEDSLRRYEVHPIISRVIDLDVDLVEKKRIGNEIIEYASRQPIPKNEDVKDYKDLTFIHTIYINYIKNTREYDTAVEYFCRCLQNPTRYNLGNCRERIGLLNDFSLENISNKLNELKTENKAKILFCIADTFSLIGEYDKAITYLRQSISYFYEVNDTYEIGSAFNLLSNCLFMNGEILEAERVLCKEAIKANKYNSEALGHSFRYLSNILSCRNQKDWASKCNDLAVDLLKRSGNLSDAYQSEYYLAESYGDFLKAYDIATKSLSESIEKNLQFSYTANLLKKGTALLNLSRLDEAKTYLERALKESQERRIDSIEIESHLELAKLYLQLEDVDSTKQHLDTIKRNFSEPLSRLYQTEMALISAQIALNQKREEDAIIEAKKAYRLAWCDGNSYSYNKQLEEAKKFLIKFGIEAPIIESKVANQAHLAELEEAAKEPKGGLPEGISNTVGWSDEEISKKYAEVKSLLNWENTTEKPKEWWEGFEDENQHRKPLILRVAEELKNRKATISEFHLTYTHSNIDNIQANLCYLDYTRLKTFVEEQKKNGVEDVSFISFLDLIDESGKELTPKTLKSEEQINEELKEIKLKLDWENTYGNARKWWEDLEKQNQHRRYLVLKLAEELENRKANIQEFFLAYVYSNTDNIQANLHYFDYSRLKKQQELKNKRKLA